MCRVKPTSIALLVLACLLVPLLAQAETEGSTGPIPRRTFDPQISNERELQEKNELFASLRKRLVRQGGNQEKLAGDSTIGGDDVVVFTTETIAQEYAYDIDITEGGDIYIAVQVLDDVNGYVIQVWRSLDSGDSWSQWGVRYDEQEDAWLAKPSLHVAEGTEDRLYLAYEYHHPTLPPMINLSHSDINLDVPDWAHKNIMGNINLSFYRPDITSDHVNFNNYRLYIVAVKDDGFSADIWFRASGDYGLNWEPGEEIGSLNAANQDYAKPKVSYGFGGKVHTVWFRNMFQIENGDDAIRYRRADNRAVNGAADWGSLYHITSPTNNYDEDDPAITGNPNNNDVVMNFTRIPEGGGLIDNVIRFSTNSGTTWDALDEDLAPITLRPHILALPSQEGYRTWGAKFVGTSYGYSAATAADPLTWDDPEVFADSKYPVDFITHQSMCDSDETHDNRLGTIFAVRNTDVAAADTLYFDAEWRHDAGYPNTEDNFPVPLAAAPDTPPALADIDADGRTPEIVFSTTDDKVHVFTRFGVELAGFPVDVGQDVSDESLAVGDLDGDGLLEIVVGTERGHVFCWDNAGNLKNGWPRDLGTNSPAYVSIGTVSKLQARDVVACSGQEIHLLRVDGSEHQFGSYPIATPEVLHSAAAIGDLDLDDTAELVIAAGDKMRVYHHDGATGIVRTMAGTDLRHSPSLGDVDDSDPALEIVVPTDDGQVWVFQHVGSNMAGWPYDTGSIDPINEVALSSIGPFSNDLAFSQHNWTVHMRAADGGGIAGWPQSSTPGWYLLGSPIVDSLGPLAGNVAIGDRGQFGTTWGTAGGVMPGWPKGLGDKCNLTPASGDIDADGKVEVVFLTDSALVVLDVNQSLSGTESRRWPMYAHDAQRTGCADCAVDLLSPVPPGVSPSRVSFALASANPSAGRTLFHYRIPVDATVSLDIMNVRGQRIRTVLRSEQIEGEHEIAWDGKDRAQRRVAQGMYIARLKVVGPGVNEQMTRKVILAR